MIFTLYTGLNRTAVCRLTTCHPLVASTHSAQFAGLSLSSLIGLGRGTRTPNLRAPNAELYLLSYTEKIFTINQRWDSNPSPSRGPTSWVLQLAARNRTLPSPGAPYMGGPFLGSGLSCCFATRTVRDQCVLLLKQAS